MFLSRIHLDPHSKEARRDLADPYELHSTLCRAFSSSEQKCPQNEFLWRLEPETDAMGFPRIMVQSRSAPDWARINLAGWLAYADDPLNLTARLGLDRLEPGQRFRFRLRANPSVCKNGKRFGLMRLPEQERWLSKKGEQCGFSLPLYESPSSTGEARPHIGVRVSQAEILRGKKHGGSSISVFSVLYDGILTVTDAEKFRSALETGIGHAKFAGLGLLSIVPVRSIQRRMHTKGE